MYFAKWYDENVLLIFLIISTSTQIETASLQQHIFHIVNIPVC